MSRGKRYDGEQKLNIKKVFAVIIAIAVIIMFVIGIKKLFNTESNVQTKTVALRYFPVYTDGKWGVIDSSGNIIINPEYDEYIVIPDNTKPLFICTLNVDYDENTYDTKVINDKNEELFTDYDLVEAIENYDESNNLWYASNILKVSNDGKYGIIDTNGSRLVACEYDSITALKGVENSLLTEKDGKYGIIDNVGSVIIDNQYEEIEPISNKYEEGYIVKDENGNCGVINFTKTVAVEVKYDDIKNDYGNGKYYIVEENNNWKILDTDGNTYLDGNYDDIISVDGENAIVEDNNKYGVVQISDGKNIIDINYDSITYAAGNNYIVQNNSKYGVINTEGNRVVDFNYTNIVYRSSANIYEATNEDYTSNLLDSNLEVKLSNVIISELNEEKGYIRVRENDEYNYYNFRFEKKSSNEILNTNTIFLSRNEEGKYGFVDRNGNVVVNYIYDEATEQNDYGYASVKQDGLWGAVDSRGQIAVSPSYSLENNVLIEFIGKWHLGQDLNLYYFTDEQT